MLPRIDIASRDFLSDRRAAYARFRKEAPLATAIINDEEVLVVSRYADAEKVFRSPRAIVQPAPNEIPAHLGSGPASVYYRNNIPSMDAPWHTQLRKVLNPLFGPSSIMKLKQDVAGIVKRKIDALHEGEIDFVAALAFPIPLEVTCSLLEMPVADAPALLDLLGPMTAIMSQAELGDKLLAQSDAATQVYFDYFERHLAARKGKTQGILGAVMQAEADGFMTHGHVLSTCLAVFIGAIHTTMTSLSNAVAVLAAHPDQRAMIAGDLSLVERAWDEILRYESPVHFRHRYFSETVELAGHAVAPRTKIMIALSSANLDEAQFENAGRFDVLREPKRHFAFGGGGHHCLGAYLARLEGQLFLSEFLTRFPSFHVSGTPPVRNEDLTFPHFEKLFLEIESRA